MKELRLQRDAKLAETDWTALSDVTMADNMKTYRQVHFVIYQHLMMVKTQH